MRSTGIVGSASGGFNRLFRGRGGGGGGDRRVRRRQVVREAVPAQVAVPAEHFAARGAVVGLDVGMGQQVGLQVGPLVEAPAAHRTLVRRFLQMEDLVDGQSTGLAEPFAALQALERFLLGMDIPVGTTENRINSTGHRIRCDKQII